MKKFFLLLLLPLMGLWGADLLAQGVSFSNLTVSSDNKIAVEVSWGNSSRTTPWSDSAWVFVDYYDATTRSMLRMPITAATLTTSSADGTAKTFFAPSNTSGFYVVGNARTAGNFSATLKITPKAGIVFTGGVHPCAYATDFPPVITYSQNAGTYTAHFFGTPSFCGELSGTTFTSNASSMTLATGKFVSSFTDATGAPGYIDCRPVAVQTLTASAAGFCPGGNVGFSLTGTQAGITYQLYRDGLAIPSATFTGTGSAQTFTGAYANGGTYTATNLGSGGYCVTAMTGALNIEAWTVPVVTCVPQSQTLCYNTTANLTVEVTGGSSAITTYRWKQGSTNVGTNTDAYTTEALAANATFTVTVTDANACSVTSNQALLTVLPNFTPGAIATTGQSICAGGTPTNIGNVTAASGGDGVITYSWYKDGTEISGATAADYTPPVADGLTAGVFTYTRRAGDGSCNNPASPATTTWVLTVVGVPAVPNVSDNGPTTAPMPVTFTATGGNGNYEWAGAVSGTGDTKTSATAVGTYTAIARSYNVSAGTTCYSAYSASTFTGCSITIASANLPGQMTWDVAMTACPAGWRLPSRAELGCMCTNKTAIGGFGTSNYWTDTEYNSLNAYTRNFSNCYEYYYSKGGNDFNVRCVKNSGMVYPIFTPGTIASTGQSFCLGSGTPTVIGSTTAASGGDGVITYSWYKDGTEISGATLTTYTPPATDATTAGTYTYTRKAKDNTMNTTPSLATGAWVLTVVGVPAVPNVSDNGPTTAPMPVTFTATGGSGNYEWAGAVNGTGDTKTSSTAVGTYTAIARSYNVSAGTTCYSAYSASTFTGCGVTIASADLPGTMNWNTALTACPAGWRLPSRAELSCMCTNQTAIGGFVANYYWPDTEYNSTTAYLRTFSNCVETNGSKSFNTYVRCVKNSGMVYPVFTPGTIASTGQSFCLGSGTPTVIGSTTAAAGGDGVITYSWYKDGTEISGATLTTYTPSTTDATTAGTYTYTRKAKDNSMTPLPTLSTGAWVLTVVDVPAVPGVTNNGPTTATTPVTFTATGGSGNYEWSGDVSGTGNPKTSPTAAGTYSAQARSYNTSSGTTCYSTYSAVSTGVVNSGGASTFSGCGITIASADLPTTMTWTTAITACPAGWRLPSRIELSCMCTNKATIGGLVGTHYWTDTENNTTAYLRWFVDCGEYANAKFAIYSVRCVM